MTEQRGGIKQTMGKMRDTVGGIAGKLSARNVDDANTLVEEAYIGDLYERLAACLALQRGSSPEIRAVAMRMLEDHTTSTHQLKAALQMNETSGVQAPSGRLDERRNRMMEHLEAAPPEKFEAFYVDQQVLAHEETLALLRNYEAEGDNAQLRSYCAGTAPVVERHLARMKALKKSQ